MREVLHSAVQEALALTGMAEVCAQLPQGLATPYCPALFSQGQHQLLGIARAIALNPRLLLLDEITANLDALTEHQIIRALQAASKDRAVLSISHRLYEASGGKIITLSLSFLNGHQSEAGNRPQVRAASIRSSSWAAVFLPK